MSIFASCPSYGSPHFFIKIFDDLYCFLFLADAISSDFIVYRILHIVSVWNLKFEISCDFTWILDIENWPLFSFEIWDFLRFHLDIGYWKLTIVLVWHLKFLVYRFFYATPNLSNTFICSALIGSYLAEKMRIISGSSLVICFQICIRPFK